MASAIDLSATMLSLSLWERSGLVGLAIVTRGVIGEGIHDFSKWFKATWWGPKGARLSLYVLVAGLAIEGVAQLNANNTSDQIIAVLGKEEADANEQIARLAPRRLSGDAKSRMTAALRGGASPPIVIVSRLLDSEGADFADDFRDAFVAAQWKTERFSNWTKSDKGVFVATTQDTALPQEVAVMLNTALTAVDIKCQIITISGNDLKTMSPKETLK
jgi:hypothetical protein